MEHSILDQFNLQGQVALVVGGNRGLGLEMSKALAEAGANISIAARDVEKNEKTASYLSENYDVKAFSTTCDVTNEEAVKSMVNATMDIFGRIDILINSAGINIRGSLEELSMKQFQSVLNVNVTGTWLTCREVVPIMKRQKYGRIVNIGSMLSVVAIPERTPYTSSKGAVLQLTRALAIELAPHKINVNCILPGPFATELNLPLTQDPEKYEAFMKNIPLGRWGELHEIGGLALFLCSPASSYVTGSPISIDGGWIAK